MKRTVAILLLIATLLISFVACAEGQQEQANDSVVQETTDPSVLDGVPADLKFNDEDVVILSRSMQGWTQDEIAVPELNSDPVNDAMFNRNVTVSDRLGVNIVSSPIEDPNQHLPIEEIERAVKAGSDEFDMVAAAAYVTAPSALEGTFVDLTELEYLDLTQDYWMQDYNDAMSYQGMQHAATGMIALSTYRFAFVTMFNKAEFDNKSIPYLYEAVANNEWTLDYQAQLAEDFYRDTNGSGKKDEGDFFGFVSCWGINTDPYWASCDMPILEKNADGEYEFVLDIARYSDVMNKILYLFYDCGGTFLYKEQASNTEQDQIREMFSSGHAAMVTLRLVAVEQPDVRNMTQEYGIVPMPKFNAEQPEYGTLLHDQFTVFCIPSSAAEHKLEMIGAVLEVMASESQRIVRPAYYEIALKRKYMSDPVAWDMLDLIFSNVVVDAGIVYCGSMEFPHHKFRTMIADNNNRVSSSYGGRLPTSVKKSLNKIVGKLERLE
jgi:hypothetical protein